MPAVRAGICWTEIRREVHGDVVRPQSARVVAAACFATFTVAFVVLLIREGPGWGNRAIEVVFAIGAACEIGALRWLWLEPQVRDDRSSSQ